MAKRISDIATQLGVSPEAIIDKCKAEGVPADKVKTHLSIVSTGLEFSIREWFADRSNGLDGFDGKGPDQGPIGGQGSSRFRV